MGFEEEVAARAAKERAQQDAWQRQRDNDNTKFLEDIKGFVEFMHKRRVPTVSIYIPDHSPRPPARWLTREPPFGTTYYRHAGYGWILDENKGDYTTQMVITTDLRKSSGATYYRESPAVSAGEPQMIGVPKQGGFATCLWLKELTEAELRYVAADCQAAAVKILNGGL